MKTYKREPAVITDKKIYNYNKFFNHLEFKGIKQDKNIFEIDQESFADALNMYVNYENNLVSREPLTLDETFAQDLVPENFSLIEAVRAGDFTVYVSQSNEEPITYTVIVDSEERPTIEGIESYHVATIQHYVICFNEKGARVFDINDPEKGWQNLTDLAEVPITKRVVGGVTTTYPANGFTEAYKEQYLWSNASQPDLPEGTADVELNTGKKTIDWTIPNTNVLTDYRILRPVEFTLEPTDLFSTAKGVICIARDDYFLLSRDNGLTFERQWYPEHGLFLNIASISKDGYYFFFVAKDGVYYCNLADGSWTKIEYFGGNGGDFGDTPGTNNICYFLTRDVWAFITYKDGNATMYWQGPGLGLVSYVFWGLAGKSEFNNLINLSDRDRTELDCDRERFVISLNEKGTVATVLATFDSTTTDKQRVLIVQGKDTQGGNSTPSVNSFEVEGTYSTVDKAYNLTQRTSTGNSATGIGAKGLVYKNGGWYEFTIEYGIEKVPNSEAAGGYAYVSFQDIAYGDEPLEVTSDEGYPYKLTGGWIDNLTVYNRDATVSARLPEEITERGTIWTVGDKFYIQSGSTVYTNDLTTNDIATLTYTYPAEVDPETGEAVFTRVPNVTYADTELYMAFDNLLQITANVYDKTDIKFNLPEVNNQSFISSVSAMVNISTTDVALFFENKIMVCSKVEDANLGYRYDYYNTKLSLGTRLGDDVINTLEGTYTIFPTLRGMAFMNYQEFMATTDQVVEYITDDIREIWTEFYKASKRIRIIQWMSHIIVTNGTHDILLFDLRSTSWWRWKVPLNVSMMLTDQVDLKLISGQQYVFKDNDRYWDFPKTTHQVRIEWNLMSQALHMSAPNYYKNIKQLIFQLVQTSNQQMTILAQIKLYRKRVTVRDPEVVAFKIDELRTFVKRFNYWKINELQWALANDPETVTPTKLMLNGITVKYEYGEEVR